MGAPSPADRSPYYTAALRCLQFVEGRKPTGRRFGPDADARWSQFEGELTTADRRDRGFPELIASCAAGAMDLGSPTVKISNIIRQLRSRVASIL